MPDILRLGEPEVQALGAPPAHAETLPPARLERGGVGRTVDGPGTPVLWTTPAPHPSATTIGGMTRPARHADDDMGGQHVLQAYVENPLEDGDALLPLHDHRIWRGLHTLLRATEVDLLPVRVLPAA